MTNTLSRNRLVAAVSCALTLGVLSGAAAAQTRPEDTNYLTDQRGGGVRSAFGLCWHTGTGPAPAKPNDCEPGVAPVAAVVDAAPKPVEIAAAPPPATPKPAGQRVTLDADALFDFDKAVLRPAGRDALDAFVANIKDIDPEVITAVGHADRFGSDSYNQNLSEQRVAAVRSYLLGKGIEANRLQTAAKGETQPVTKAGDCAGAKSTKVIACLQPDRRVEVEVVGTRSAR